MSEISTNNYSYDENNVFAKLIRGDLPSEKLYEDNYMIIIKDTNPITELHFLAIPKGRYVNYDHFIKLSNLEQMGHFFKQISKFVNKIGIEDNCKILCNNGFNQSVRHFHMHIMSGKILKNDSLVHTN